MANCLDVNSELLSKYRSTAADNVTNNCSNPSRLVQMLYLQSAKYSGGIMTEKNNSERRSSGIWCENGVDTTHLKEHHKKRMSSSLPSNTEKEEITEEMLDWEWYMRCKEHYYEPSLSDEHQMPPIRNGSTTNSVTKPKRFALSKTYCDSEDDISTEGPVCARNVEMEDSEFSEQRKKSCETADLQKAIGNQFYNSRQYEEAIAHYSEALRLYEIINLFLNNTAETCSDGKTEIRSKLTIEENATPYSEKIIHLLNNRAMSNIKLENFDEALTDLNEILKTDPRNVKARFRRAKCWRQFRMYEQALKDIIILLEIQPTLQDAKILRNQIEEDKSISGGGKLYRVRENFDQKDTFNVEEGRLAVYANCKEEYLVEVDKTGCVKYCICTFCTSEDRRTMNKSTGLRIKERDRWKLLTQDLLNEMKISSKEYIVASKKVHENAATIPCELQSPPPNKAKE